MAPTRFKSRGQVVYAEDIHCGDVFEFHGDLYVALGQCTDGRHTQTVIFALSEESASMPVREVQPFRLLRTFPLRVVARGRYRLRAIMKNTEPEVRRGHHPLGG